MRLGPQHSGKAFYFEYGARVITNNEADRPVPVAELASAFSEFRELVLDQWRLRVAAEIPVAAALDGPLLIDMVPKLYDNIAAALSEDSPNAFATVGTNLATAHGRERANMTDYAPHDLIHELQIFREVLFSMTKDKGLHLSRRDAEVIGHSIEEAARESINGFSEADREKNVDFIASLSHDLRNPLSVANASAQLIQLKTADPSIINLARRVCKKIAEADAMIQTLLDAAMRQGRMRLKLKLTNFDIMSLIEEVCADLPLLDQRVRVFGEPIIGQWCRGSMKRVLENLITNAQKYGDPAEPITVRAYCEKENMCLSVHNEGAPIPSVEIDRLFKPYQRIENTDVKGWGLGLPYVQNVAESHGGTVVIESDVGKGTTFTVILPIDASPYVKK
jgi:signal transduction histidine kinase